MEYDVSLIIIAYNEEKYIPILLDSIISQKTDLKMEIILVDDSSTDNTVNIAKSYNSVKIMHNDRKGDLSYMKNNALEKCLGKVVIFFDSDLAISDNFIENMVRPILDGRTDTMLCKTYAILEAFYDVLPDNYSKSYVNFIRHCPRFMVKRFPVQFIPWIGRWFKMMKDKKRIVSIWRVPNRTHATGISTRVDIARKIGGWEGCIGSGDDALYSNRVCEASNSVLWSKNCILFLSRRRVFPTDNGWITDILFKPIKKWYKHKIKKKSDNDYTQHVR